MAEKLRNHNMAKTADKYFADGCGRCRLGGTPNCKVHNWDEELKELRRIILASGLTEESKWGVPTYTAQGRNILILAAFKEYFSVSFFKGALLNNAAGILVSPGENSQAAMMIRFTSFLEVKKLELVIGAYIVEAIETETSSKKIELKKPGEYLIPEEFQSYLDEMPELKKAFFALTPGRQRGYLLQFSVPKQVKTRNARIEKYLQRILEGKGLADE